MTELEQAQLKLYKQYLRLSMERDLYTIPQAAFRMGISPNVFEERFVMSGIIILKFEDGKKLVPKSELQKAIDKMQNIVHKREYNLTINYTGSGRDNGS